MYYPQTTKKLYCWIFIYLGKLDRSGRDRSHIVTRFRREDAYWCFCFHWQVDSWWLVYMLRCVHVCVCSNEAADCCWALANQIRSRGRMIGSSGWLFILYDCHNGPIIHPAHHWVNRSPTSISTLFYASSLIIEDHIRLSKLLVHSVGGKFKFEKLDFPTNISSKVHLSATVLSLWNRNIKHSLPPLHMT